MITKILLVASILFSVNSFGALKPSGLKALKKPFYLGNKEVKKLKKELKRIKHSDETFVLKFVCNKYKKNQKAKNRSINCLAVSVSPEPAVK